MTRYQPDPKQGLSTQQVRQRLADGLVNTDVQMISKTAGQIICSNVFTYFNFVFFALALVLASVRSWNNLTFLIVVVANTLIGIVQEIRARRELERLQIVSAPETMTIRDGRLMRIPSNELVLDDVVCFSAGQQICADAILLKGELMVNESLVTGESEEQFKRSGDLLLSGSIVVSGKATARLERVGEASFAAKLSKEAKQIKKKQQPGMMKSLTRLIQVIGVLIVPFFVLMYHNQHTVLALSHKVSVENTAAAIIGMIPEGLYLLTSIALAAGMVRLSKQRTLVHDMKCIERLARVDVLCVDKTGTITEETMKLKEVIPLSGQEQCKQQLGDFVCAMQADNDTMRALQEYFREHAASRKPDRIRGFSAKEKYSAADYGEEIHYLGAPEFLIREPEEELQQTIDAHLAAGERVLLLAAYTRTEEESRQDSKNSYQPLDLKLNPLALVTLKNPVRAQAKETFQYFREQNVTVKVISGDHPATASAAAIEAGIPNAENCIDVSQLEREELSQAASSYTVFGRVTPEKKRMLIQALKSAGHTVAMTGDGVNDVLALKDADCSIAMASGSEAAANVSDLVLLDSDFSGMPKVVAEGRRVINNIERSASLFLVKNIFSFVLCLISLIFGTLYPMKPAQVSLVSGLMIGIPSFFLTFEPNHDRVDGKFLRNVLFRAFPAGLTAVILVEWAVLFSVAFQIPEEQISTVSFFVFAFAAYVMLFRVCRPIKGWHAVLFGGMGVLFVAITFSIPGWFQMARLEFGCVLILISLLCLVVPLDALLQWLWRLPVQWKKAWLDRKEHRKEDKKKNSRINFRRK